MSNLPKKPFTRVEQYLSNIVGETTSLPKKPLSRVEQYLAYIVEHGGGGGGGASSWDDLANKPFSTIGEWLKVDDDGALNAISGMRVVTALPADSILVNNTEYRIGTVSALTVNGFGAGETGYAELWSVIFTADTGITVSVPASVVWAVATPVFEAGKTYWLSFTPMGSGYLGVWSVSA